MGFKWRNVDWLAWAGWTVRALGVAIAVVVVTFVGYFLYILVQISRLDSNSTSSEDNFASSESEPGTAGEEPVQGGCLSAEGNFGSSPVTLWASPYRICPGQTFAVRGFGYKAGAAVTLEVPSKGILGTGQVDASGTLYVTAGPIDESFCSLPNEASLIAVIDGTPERVSAELC